MRGANQQIVVGCRFATHPRRCVAKQVAGKGQNANLSLLMEEALVGEVHRARQMPRGLAYGVGHTTVALIPIRHLA